QTMGISPKCFSGLVRYQMLWREMALCGDFNVLDAVEKYGYTDQAHLLNDFRKRHLMNPKQALEYAKKF
ncbi:MAG: helix-turn-helix domain-containing protein, partial [Oscillospiraceae bacterium]|nr:helix-turn-helix domain-containing protein [Oscillospiraceae bacterium]